MLHPTALSRVRSFFGAPKDGSGGPSSSAKKTLPSSSKPLKTKTKVASASKKSSGTSLKANDSRKEGTVKGDLPLPKEGEKASSKEAMAGTGKRKTEENKGFTRDVHVSEGSEEEEEAESVKPKRLCRLSAKVIAEDDDRFVGFVRMGRELYCREIVEFLSFDGLSLLVDGRGWRLIDQDFVRAVFQR